MKKNKKNDYECNWMLKMEFIKMIKRCFEKYHIILYIKWNEMKKWIKCDDWLKLKM